MALNDSLRSFAKRPKGQKIAVFVGGAAVVVLLYYQLYYSGMGDELGNLETQNQQLTTQNQQLQAREKQYKELVKKNDELKEQLVKNRISLPTSAELPAFFVHLQKQAASSGISINSLSRKREIPVGTSYVKVPVAMRISGTFYQIIHYFKLLSETDRIITVESLGLGGARVRADETILTATFFASTFRLPGDGTDDLYKGDPEEEAATKPASLKDRAKAKVEAARERREKDVAERSGETIEGSGGQEGEQQGTGNAQQDGVNRITGGGGTAP